MDSDWDIVRRVTAGDKSAYAGLVEKYRHPVFKLCLAMTGDIQDAEDLAQESFIRAYRSLGLFRPQAPFYPWIHSIALNLVRNHLKRRKVIGRRLADDEDPARVPSTAADPEEDAVLQREILDLAERIRRLPPSLAEPIVLRYFQDMSFEEAARVLKISPAAARMRVHRGLSKLKAWMAEAISEGPTGENDPEGENNTPDL